MYARDYQSSPPAQPGKQSCSVPVETFDNRAALEELARRNAAEQAKNMSEERSKQCGKCESEARPSQPAMALQKTECACEEKKQCGIKKFISCLCADDLLLILLIFLLLGDGNDDNDIIVPLLLALLLFL